MNGPGRRISTPLIVVIAIATACVAVGVRLVSGNIARDSGVFMYTGMVVSTGGMPYVDSWDHKGPLIAIVNALAWAASGDPDGVVIAETVVLAVALAVAGVLWTALVPRVIAVAALVVLGVTYVLVSEGGNYTETWQFPLQLVAYSAVARTLLAGERRRRWIVVTGVLLGTTIGVGAMMRVNNIGGTVLLAVAWLVLLRRGERSAASWPLAITGAVVTVAPLLWLWSGDALRAGFTQYVEYNLVYAGATVDLVGRIAGFGELVRILAFSPAGFALTALTIVFVVTRPERGGHRDDRLLGAMLIVLCADLLSQALSGRPYPHYVVVTLPAAAVAGILLLRVLHPWFAQKGAALAGRGARPAVAVLATLAVASVALVVPQVATSLSDGRHVAGSWQEALVGYVGAHTEADDRVLVYGAETWLLAASDRRSPTAVTYVLPIVDGFPGVAEVFLAQALDDPPRYVIENTLFCGISWECAPSQPEITEFAAFIRDGYHLETDIGSMRFWRRTEP